MKSKNILTFFICLMIFVSCKKENDAGVLIDGNGKPRPVTKAAGITGADFNNTSTAKDSTILNEYGIAIDPNGRQ